MTLDPFRIDGPASISFSGGRTSAFMLRRILDAHGGALPDDVHVAFANTGKERLETLDFVEECSRRWAVPITWIEAHITTADGQLSHGFRIVDHATASREGEPFAALIRARSFLPNPVMRFCTQELKIRPMAKYNRSRGWDSWTNVIGLRADEPRRVAKITAPTREVDNVCPLAEAGVTLTDVTVFWKSQPFDLGLRSYEGNCDLCYLKGRSKIERIMRDRPDLAQWWIEQESLPFGERADARFRHDRPSYLQMLDSVQRQPMLPGLDEDDDGTLPCACTD